MIPSAQQLATDILSLGTDHRTVVQSILLTIVERSKRALPQYGALHLDTDTRDFKNELIAELVDGLTYSHADNVKLERENADLRSRIGEQFEEVKRLRGQLALMQSQRRTVPR